MNSIAIDPDRIRDRAYARWQQRGCPAGSADADWLAAEQELLVEARGQSLGAVAPIVGNAAAQRGTPPHPTLKRAPSARAVRLLNEPASGARPQTRAQQAIAAAAAAEARVRRSALGTG